MTAFTAWESGWYVADGDVTIDSRVTVNGNVNLILKDGANLTVQGGISVPEGSMFTVYGQQNGTGNLTSIGTNGNAGIGGSKADVNFGTIILAAKGKIVAAGDTRAAGIGGGGLINNGAAVTERPYLSRHHRSHRRFLGGRHRRRRGFHHKLYDSHRRRNH